MSYIPSDNARTYVDSVTHQHMITYTAIPVDIPGVYRTTLIQLGDWCRRSIGRPDYVLAQKELDAYERKLRKDFGQLVTREEYRPKEWDGRHDN
jgi:hypothetical protein